MVKLFNRLKSFFNNDECKNYYEFGKTLGTGSFSTVKLGKCKADDSFWAIKCISKSNLQMEDREGLKNEVEVLQKIDHKNIVKLREVFDCRNVFYMVMENMEGGELFDSIVEKEKYSEMEAQKVMRQVTEAIIYCHEKGIVHRDLKPENLLYAEKSTESAIKVADFGLSAILKDDNADMTTTCGTPGYVAPEIVKCSPYNESVDIWSMGIILYILLCGFPPFYDENNAALFTKIKSGKFDYPSPYWDDVSDSAKDLINKMLNVDPLQRLAGKEILEHPWMKSDASLNHLTHFQSQMKKFNAKRRFKAGVNMIQALTRVTKLTET